MKQYLSLVEHILKHGTKKDDRTGTGTISIFGYQMRFDLQEGFPLLTTKKVYFPAVVKELLWFITGSTNIQDLCKQNVRIWNEWPYARYQKSSTFQGESMQEFIQKIVTDDDFAKIHGDLGPVYGKQWRDFLGVDQLLQVERSLKEDPMSRRHIISAWNPSEVEHMALPPCHAFIQFYVSGDRKKLSCQLYQRSADVFLGVPFNIASYALLLVMFAHVCGYEVGEFVHTLGDAHIYQNHMDQVNEQIQRQPLPLPIIRIKRKVNSIVDFTYDDFVLELYQSHPAIKGEVSV